MVYDAGPCGYNSFSQWRVTAGLVSISLAEKRVLRREAKAQSVPKSGPYTSLLTGSKHNQLDANPFYHTSIRLSRLATHSGDLGDGRLAVICNSS